MRKTLEKACDLVVTEFGEINSDQPNRLVILLDKGYQGAQEFIHDIHLKMALHEILSASDCKFNRKVSKDRIVVEKVFKRLTSL